MVDEILHSEPDNVLRQPPKEKPQPCWVPMRTDQLGGPHRREFGLARWTPQFILFGNHLEIDVNGINTLLKRLQLSIPIEIVPFTPPKQEDKIVIHSVSPNGEAVATAAKGKVLKPAPSKVEADTINKCLRLAINFQGIADFLERELPNGRNNPKFFKKYGEMVDEALIDSVPYVIRAHLDYLMTADPKISEENFLATFLLIMNLISNSYNSSADYCHDDQHSPSENLPPFPTLKNLLKPVRPGNVHHPISKLHPDNLFRYAIRPFLHAFTWLSPLIRARQSNP